MCWIGCSHNVNHRVWPMCSIASVSVVNSIICVEYYLSAVLCLCSIVCVERGVIVRMRATWRTERPPDSFPSQPPDSVMPLRWDGSSVLLCEIELVLCVFSLEGATKTNCKAFQFDMALWAMRRSLTAIRATVESISLRVFERGFWSRFL